MTDETSGSVAVVPGAHPVLAGGDGAAPGVRPDIAAGEPLPGGLGSPTGPGTPSPRRRRGIAILALAIASVLGCAGGFGIGYSLWGSRAPGGTPSRAPLTPELARMATRVDPELVDVVTSLDYQTATAAGTGMVVDPSGTVVTNNHVIEGATMIRVTDVGTCETYRATVVGYDVRADVAVLQLEGASDLETVTFAGSPATAGQRVVVIGNAGGRGGTPTAGAGTVTALGQSVAAEDKLAGRAEHLTGLIETDALVQGGDSGGPLVDTAGRVVGMDTASSTSYAFTLRTHHGYAVPIATVEAVSRQIEAGIASSQVHIGPTAFLGVQVEATDAAGARVVHVETDTPATAVGLEPGEVIESLGGHAIGSPTALSAVIQAHAPGDVLSLGWRTASGRQETSTVTLGSGPPG